MPCRFPSALAASLSRTCPRMLALAALCLFALPGVSRADTVPTWTITSDTTWTSTSGGTGDGVRTVQQYGQIYNGAVLNQTGGTIDLSNSQYGMIIAQTSLGTYNMSGNAIYLSDHVLLGNNASGTWTLTDTASVTISPANGQLGDLSFGRASEAADAGKSRYLLLSGAASFTVTSLVFGKTDDDYISFATGSTATFTAGNKVLTDYQALVAAGNIRVDGVVQTDFSKFQVTGTGGHTLSLISDPFNLWANGTFANGTLTDKTPTGDPDSDGLSNMLEYAFGTDPTVSYSGEIVYDGTHVITPGCPKIVEDSGMYYMVFGRRADYLTAGITYTVQFTAGLDFWADNNDTDNPPQEMTAIGTIHVVRVPYPDSIVTPSGNPKPTFARVRVSMP